MHLEAPAALPAQIIPHHHPDCDPPKLRCSSGGRCLDRALLCDGSADCPDAEDEKECQKRE